MKEASLLTVYTFSLAKGTKTLYGSEKTLILLVNIYSKASRSRRNPKLLKKVYLSVCPGNDRLRVFVHFSQENLCTVCNEDFFLRSVRSTYNDVRKL